MNAITSELEARLEAFATEMREILAAFEGDFIALEARRYDREMLDALFQSVSRIDASAQRAGLDSVRAVTGVLGDLVERLRMLSVPPGPEYLHVLKRMLIEVTEPTADAFAGASLSRDGAPRPTTDGAWASTIPEHGTKEKR